MLIIILEIIYNINSFDFSFFIEKRNNIISINIDTKQNSPINDNKELRILS